MKRFIISILIIVISLFFINSKANFKYNVNYITVNRHMENTERLKNDDVAVYNYIISEIKNYDVEIEEYDETIIVTKKSDNPNAKDIGFITNYNSFNNTNSHSLSLGTMLSSIQSYNKQTTSNNLYFIFSKNNSEAINDNISYLNDTPYILNQLDFVFSFNSIGNTGDVFINETSKVNKDITLFFKNSVSAASGFSDIALKNNEIELNGVQSLTFGLLNSAHLELEKIDMKNLDENTKNNYINTINELVISSHSYEFEETNTSLFYFNYFDSFITINDYLAYAFLAIAALLTIIYSIYYSNQINIVKTLLYTITNSVVLAIAFLFSILPLSELLELFNIDNSNTLIVDFIYLSTLLVILLIAIIIVTISKFKYDMTFVQTIISSIIILFILSVSFYVKFQTINVILAVLSIIFAISLYFVKQENRSMEKIITVVTIISLPIITYEIYFIYALSSVTSIFSYAVTIACYTQIILPIIIFFKKKIRT